MGKVSKSFINGFNLNGCALLKGFFLAAEQKGSHWLTQVNPLGWAGTTLRSIYASNLWNMSDAGATSIVMAKVHVRGHGISASYPALQTENTHINVPICDARI